MKEQLIIYPIPKEVEQNNDFTVRVRIPDHEWEVVTPWKVHVDMHNVREASMVYFDFLGVVEIEIASNNYRIKQVVVRPLSYSITPQLDSEKVIFTLDKPCNLSVEINGDRFHNLHLFAGAPEENVPDKNDPGVLYVPAGNHAPADLYTPLTTINPVTNKEPHTLYFGAGLHEIIGKTLFIPSNKTIYFEGGSAVWSSFLCKNTENTVFKGRGAIYLFHEPWKTHIHGIQIANSKHITVDGIIFLNPSGHSVSAGESEDVTIRGIKSFSCWGWTDGIDFFASKNCFVQNVFMRNSDDCIAIYGTRLGYRGDVKNIVICDSILWADVAHPCLIGTHGAYDADGNILEDITLRNIDILEHHEPQDNYLGCLSVNVGDGNIARNILFEDIRVEDFERGRLVDVRVFFNKDYNPVPGRGIENVTFRNLSYQGRNEIPSHIYGYDDNRMVSNVIFDNLTINGTKIMSATEGNIEIGSYAENVTFY